MQFLFASNEKIQNQQQTVLLHLRFENRTVVHQEKFREFDKNPTTMGNTSRQHQIRNGKSSFVSGFQ